jgi:hypothetical protein
VLTRIRNVGAAIWPSSVAAAASLKPPWPQLSQLTALSPHIECHYRARFAGRPHFDSGFFLTGANERSIPAKASFFFSLFWDSMIDGRSACSQLSKPYHILDVTELGRRIPMNFSSFCRLIIEPCNPGARPTPQGPRGARRRRRYRIYCAPNQRGHLAAGVTINWWEVGRLPRCFSPLGLQHSKLTLGA